MKIRNYNRLDGCYEIELENEDDIEFSFKHCFENFYTAKDFKYYLNNHDQKIIVHKNHPSQLFKKIVKRERVKKLKKIL